MEICRIGSISKSHPLTNLNKCRKFHACIRNSTILALSRLAKICLTHLSMFQEYTKILIFPMGFFPCRDFSPIVRKKIRKRRLLKKVQAFCEENVLRCLFGVFWYAESKSQCWQASSLSNFHISKMAAKLKKNQ